MLIIGLRLAVAFAAALAVEASAGDATTLSPLDEHGELGAALAGAIGRRGKASTIRRGGRAGMSTMGSFHLTAFQGNHEEDMLGEASELGGETPDTLGESIAADLRQVSAETASLTPATVKIIQGLVEKHACPARPAAPRHKTPAKKGKGKFVDFNDGAWDWVRLWNDARAGSKKDSSSTTKGSWHCQTENMGTGQEHSARYSDCRILKKEFWTEKGCCYAGQNCRQLKQAPKYCLVKDRKGKCETASVCIVGSWKRTKSKLWEGQPTVSEREHGKPYKVYAKLANSNGKFLAKACTPRGAGSRTLRELDFYAWYVKMDLRKVMVCQAEPGKGGRRKCSVQKHGKILEMIPHKVSQPRCGQNAKARKNGFCGNKDLKKLFGKGLGHNWGNSANWANIQDFGKKKMKAGQFASGSEFAKAIFANKECGEKWRKAAEKILSQNLEWMLSSL